MKLTIPIAPSGNRMWRHTKNGIVYKTTECKNYQETVKMLARIETKKQCWNMTEDEKVIIEYTYFWPDNRARDTGNQKKVINDALEGVLYDNDRWILERDIDWTIDKHDPRIELIVRKYK